MKPVLSPEPTDDPLAGVARQFFATAAVVCGGSALLMASASLPLALRAGLALGFLATAALSVAALRWPRRRGQRAMAAICLAALALIGVTALASGWGLNGPGIGFVAILVLSASGLVSPRMGLLTALAGTAMLLGLAGAEHAGLLPGPGALAQAPLARRLAVHLMLLGAGLGAGLLIARVVGHYMDANAERQSRFIGLLGIATRAYWEADERHHLTGLWIRSATGHFDLVPTPAGPPWAHPGTVIDPEVLRQHQQAVAERRPFHDVPVTRHEADGTVWHQRVSGEPRFDKAGRFLGYWGVTRDVTEEVRTRLALAETEEAQRRSQALLAQVVETTPDAITLSDLATGRYVMVNEAFEAMSGRTRAEAIGRTSIELGLWGNPQDREALLAELAAHGTVRNRPVRFVAKSGRTFALLVSAARFDIEQGSYLVLAARDVSASERARLAHEAVLDNASLGIAFTLDGRFVQANRALERMFGWEDGSLAGRSDRVVWPSDAEHVEFGKRIAAPLAAGEPVEFAQEMGRRDGSRFWCRMLAKAVDPAHPMRGGTIWIVEDITERRRVDQALAKARDDAEAASRAKSAFLANTSHEIRTPLNGLVGLARLARRPDVDPVRLRQYLEQIGDSAETLAAVISDVLDLAKIEAGRLQLEALPFDLHELLGSIGRVYGTLADARGLAFRLEIDAALPRHVVGDAVRLRQILGNYLHNALKFTASGGITLTASSRGAMVRLEVADTGPGIAPEVQARLFSAFTQADASTTRRYGGTGLGLSICRELAALMGGAVGLASLPGEGSRFWAELPLPPAPAGAAARAEPDDTARLLAGARVLLAEDNPVNMMIAVALLEQWGVVVTQATDGAQAVAEAERALAAGRPFDAVLMDVQMPVMSGHEAARRMRRLQDAQALPIIALTAAALTSERELAEAAGMTGFLTKPIDIQRLRDTLAGALAQRAAART